RSLRARLRDRQGDLGTTPFGGADRHLAALAFDDVAGEIEPEPGAAAGLLGGEERFADAAEEMLRHADAVVADREAERVADAHEQDAHVARFAALGRLEGIVEEVRDRLLEGADGEPDSRALG